MNETEYLTKLFEKAIDRRLGEKIRERVKFDNPTYSRLLEKLSDENIGQVTRIMAKAYGLDFAAYGYAILKGEI